MKTKKSKLIAFAVACILAICAIAVAACDFKFRSKELVDLKIDTANVQTVFHPGDEFNSDNLVVTAHYDDGSKVVLKSGYHVRDVAIDHVTTDETRAEGRDSVRVVYGEKETTYDVTISQVASLRLDTGAVQKSFRQDAPFTYDKLKVYARYTDGTERLLESGEYSATADTGRTGSATATVTATFPVFGEKGAVVSQAFTANYQISVQAHNLKSIYVKEGPATKDYFVGDEFDPAGLEVYGVFEGEADRLVEDEFTFTADGLEDGVFTKAGNIEVTVHDGELTATFSVNVTAVALENIELGGTYAKEFFAGDALDYKGLTVTAVYNNGDRKPVTSGFTVTANNLEGGKLTVKSDTVTVSYEEGGVRKDATYTITVKAVVLDKIEISTPASKLEFFTSEAFTAEGLAITATYNNKTTKVVTYTEAENNGLTVVKPTMSAGSQQVTVKFTDGGVTKDVTYNITVKAVVLDRIELGGTYAKEFFEGDTLDYDGLTVTAVYNDGNSKPVESGFTVTANNLDGDKLTVKSDTVTVSYTDGVTKDATYKITVQAVVVESLTLGGEYNTDFYVGDEFNHDGLTVTAHFNHGDDQVVTEKAEVSEPDLTSAGKKQVTVTYGAGEAIYTVTVYNKLTGLLVTDSFKEYKEGDNFDQSTLTVKALYNDAADGETVEGFTVEGAPEGALEAREYTVTVEYTVDDAENFNRGTATKEYTFNVTKTTVTHTVTVTLVPEEGGSYALDVEGGVYEEGATATLTVTCNPEYAIQSVKNGADDLSANEEGKYTVQVNDDIEITVTFVKKSLSNFNNYDFGAPARLNFYLAYTGYSEEEMYAAVLLIGEREVNRVDHLGVPQLFYFDLPTDLAKGTNDLSIKMPDGQIFKITFDPSNFANTHNNSLELDGTVFTFGLSAENQMQLTVTAAERTVTITDVDPAEGSITVKNGDNEVRSGDKVPVGTELTIEVKAADGYALDSVMADSDQIEIAEGKGTYRVEKDVTITATFNAEGATTHKVNVTVNGEGGTYDLNPPAEGDGYESGTQVTLTVKPDTHYGYEISITGAEYTNEGDVFTITIGNSTVTVTITFFARSFTNPHNAIVNDNEGLVFFGFTTGYKGSEVKNLILMVGDHEVANYEAGYDEDLDSVGGARVFRFHVQEVKVAGKFKLSLKFSENDVYDLTLDCSLGFTLGDFEYQFSYEGGQCYLTITDNSVPEEYTVTVNTTGEGTVTVKKTEGDEVVTSGSKVTENTSLTVTAEAGAGYKLATFTVGGAPVEGTTHTFLITQDTVIDVVFVAEDAKTYTLKVEEAGGTGSYTAQPDGPYYSGASVTITVTPPDGFVVDSVTATGSDVTDHKDGTYTVTFADSDITVTITYKEKPAGVVHAINNDELWTNGVDVRILFFVQTANFSKEELSAAKLVIKGHEASLTADGTNLLYEQVGDYQNSHLWFSIKDITELMENESISLTIGGVTIPLKINAGYQAGTQSLNGLTYHIEQNTEGVLALTITQEGGGEEKDINVDSGGEEACDGKWVYWNDQGSGGTVVTSTKVKMTDNGADGLTFELAFSATGGTCTYGFQLFYNNRATYPDGTKVKITGTISGTAGTVVKIDGIGITLDQPFEITRDVNYTGSYTGQTLFSMQVVCEGDHSYELTLTNIKFEKLADPDPAQKSITATGATLEVNGDKVYFVITGTCTGYDQASLKEELDYASGFSDFAEKDIGKYGFDLQTRGDPWTRHIKVPVEVTVDGSGNFTVKYDVTDVPVHSNPYTGHFGSIRDNNGYGPADLKLTTDVAEDGKFVTVGDKKYTLVNKNGSTLDSDNWGCVSLKVENAEWSISSVKAVALETNDEGTVAYYTVTLESSGIGADAKDDFTLFEGDVTFDCAKAEVVEGGLKLYFDVTARELGKTWFYPHLKYKGAPWNGSNGDITVEDFDEKKITVGFKEYRTHCNATETYGMPVLDVVISPKAYTVNWNDITLAAEDGRAILTITGTLAEGVPQLKIEADLQKHEHGYDSTVKMGSATYEGQNWTLKIDITDVVAFADDIYIVHIYIDGVRVDVDFGGGSAEGFTPSDAFTEAEKTFQLGTAENLFDDGRTFLTVSIKTADPEPTHVTNATYNPLVRGHAREDDLNGVTEKIKDVSVTYAQNTASNPPKFYSEVRVYPGGTITVSVPEGYKLTAITFTYTEANTISANVGALDGKAWTGSETSVVFTVLAKSGSGGHIKLTEIAITYLAPTEECTHPRLTKEAGTPAECEKDGIADYWICDECGRWFSKGENPTDDNEIFAPVEIEALGHSYTEWVDDGDGMHHTSTCDRCHTQQFTEVHDKDGEGGTCSKCGATVTGDVEEKLLATFDLGSATADDNNAEYKNQYTETNGSYTLTLESPSKVYPGKGGTLKLGSGTAAGKFSFTVPDNVSMVKIYVGQYSGKSVQITINGTTYSVTKNSDNSNGAEFECFEIDTTSVKKIEFATKKPSSGDYRVRIDKIEFYGTDSAAAAASTTLVSATPDLFVEDKH